MASIVSPSARSASASASRSSAQEVSSTVLLAEQFDHAWLRLFCDEGHEVVAREQTSTEVFRSVLQFEGDQVLTAIASSDNAALGSLVPAAALESVGAQFATFVPASDIPACDRLDDGSAHCIIFEHEPPFALAITLEPSDTLGWAVAAVSYDSTN